MRLNAVLPLLLLASPLAAQYVVIDADTREAIPYASLLYPGYPGGQVTDENGTFRGEWPVGTDSLRITAIGYRDRYASVPQAVVDTFELQPVAYTLSVVTVTANRFRRERSYGRLPRSEKLVVQFIGKQRGAQIGRPLRLPRESLLKRATVSIVTNSYGNARCRLNFYPMEGDSIGPTPLNRRDILLNISGIGNFSVDLANENLVHTGDLLMALELLENPRREGTIYVGGQLFGAGTQVRRGSGEQWQRGSVTGPVPLSPGFRLTVLE